MPLCKSYLMYKKPMSLFYKPLPYFFKSESHVFAGPKQNLNWERLKFTLTETRKVLRSFCT